MKYNDDFINPWTGEVQKRERYGKDHGTIYLSDQEIDWLQDIVEKNQQYLTEDLKTMVDIADRCVYLNWDYIPMGYEYMIRHIQNAIDFNARNKKSNCI